MRIQRFLTACLLALVASSALALDRPFPPVAKRGTMTLGDFPALAIDGNVRQMSMGGRIFNQQNLIQMPASITGSSLVVNYTEDFQGYIDRVWLLTEKEAAQTPAEQKISNPR